ncbi:MAG: hypothetical protein J2P15_08895 [Micromonosporaceae bacterium]|nr:hypothetical protein [Micromonosporaceae bacterium]
MTVAYAELFTPTLLTDPDQGRQLIEALITHVPYWTPHRYGFAEPPRHKFSLDRVEHFWSQEPYFRNAARTLNGSVDVRTGPWAILSKIKMSGRFTQELSGDGLGAFLAACGAAPAAEISYGMAHLFTDEENAAYYRDWFELSPAKNEANTKSAAQGTMPYFLRDLYWANLFGPPYTELFGIERLSSAPAAVARQLQPGYFYLQLTDDIADRAGIAAIRERVKAHIGPDCFYDPKATTPRRAPRFITSAEAGLWTPPEGTNWTDELRALYAKAPKP